MSPQPPDVSRRMFVFSLSLITASALSFEILLMRLFSVGYGHHFASMIVSLALLGLGTGGIVRQLFQRRLRSFGDRFYPVTAFLYGVSLVGSYLLAQTIPFNPREMTWSILPWLALAAQYLVYAVPFFLSGLFVASAMSDHRFSTHRLYRADMLGSGVGAASLPLILFFLPAHRCLTLIGCIAMVAAAMTAAAMPHRARSKIPAVLTGIGIGMLLLPVSVLEPALSPYKELAVLRLIPGAEVLAETNTPTAHLQIVRVPGSPLQRAPGLSAECEHDLPVQLGVFTDGNLHGTLPVSDGSEDVSAYLTCLPITGAFLQAHRPRVLIKEVFASPELLIAARQHDAEIVTGATTVFALPETLAAVLDEHTKGLYFRPPVRYVPGMARSVIAASDEKFDVIGFWMSGSGGQAVGATSITEQFDLTVQGLEVLIAHLSPDGILAVSMWNRRPPYELLKFLATVQAAKGKNAAGHLTVLATPSTLTVLFKNRSWTGPEKKSLQQFAAARSFALLLHPFRDPGALGAGGVSSPWTDIQRLFGPDAEAFRRDYKFYIEPATDDRPFFHRFFSWRSVWELLQERTRGGAALLQWDYAARLVTLSIASLLGAALLVLPMASRGSSGDILPPPKRAIFYFGSLGLGFLFVELTFVHLFTLFLGHPFLSACVVVASFLVWAGAGSGTAKRFELSGVLIVIVSVLLLCAAGLGRLLHALAPLPLAARILITAVLCGVPAFFMGMPFPKALSMLRRGHPEGIPWAWGINGFASVISPLLAVLLAIHFGFTRVLILAAIAYLAAWLHRPETS